MKKEKINLIKLFKIGILFFGISLLLWNCEKDEVFIENTTSINLEKVKSIYKTEFNQKEFSNLKNEPLWNEAKILYYNDKEYLEIPFRIVKQSDLNKSTSMSNDRLLAFISPDNKLTVNIVHYFAQDIKKSIPDFQNLSYFDIGNFNGFVTLYDLDKNIISLNKFNNGIKSKKQYTIYEKKKNDDNVFYRMPTDCEMHTETIVTESCWFWYYHETNTTEIITCSYSYDTVTYQTCDTSGEGTSGNTVITEEEIVEITDDGFKPIYEDDNKCNGVNQLWNYSQSSGDEYAAVLTTDGAILITQQLNTTGGGISGIYEFNGNTYYQYPTSQGAPSRTYQGQLISSGRYFIPISATLHSHTPCLNDGTDGITNNTINDDQNFAQRFSNIKHYIIGCNAIGEFNGNSNQAFNIQTGNLSSTCHNIN